MQHTFFHGLLIYVLSSFCLIAHASVDSHLEEMLVQGISDDDDPTQMDEETAALIKTPGAVGDPVRASLALPGITFGEDDLSAPSVRGTGSKDNQYLLDGIPLPYMFHLLGDSVISAGAIRRFEVFKSAQSLPYNNVLGGVFSMTLKDPVPGFNGYAEFSPLKTGILAGKSSGPNAFYAAYRHNLMHLFLTRYEDTGGAVIDEMPEARDYAMRYQYSGEHNTFRATALGAADKQNSRLINRLGGATIKRDKRYFDSASLQWQHALKNDDAFTLSYSAYHFADNEETFVLTESEQKERETNQYLRAQYTMNRDNHQWSFGTLFDSETIRIRQKGLDALCDDFALTCFAFFNEEEQNIQQTFNYYAFYTDDLWQINDKFTMNLGIYYALDEFFEENYPELHFGAVFTPTDKHSLYLRGGTFHQQLQKQHIVLNNNTQSLTAEKSHQLALGYQWSIDDQWSIQSDIYYKDLDDLLLYDNGTPTNQLQGTIQGVELTLANRISNRWYGWLALSYTDSTRQNKLTREEIDFRYSTPFALNGVININIGKGWSLGASYFYQDGPRHTPVQNIEYIGNNPQDLSSYRIVYGKTNSAQLDTVKRLDFRLQKTFSFNTTKEAIIYFDTINILGESNRFDRDYFLSLNNNQVTLENDDSTGIPRFFTIGAIVSF